MIEKIYGQWKVSEIATWLKILSPGAQPDEEIVATIIDALKRENAYDSYLQAFALLIADDSISFAEKSDLCLEEGFTSASAWDYFQWIWKSLSLGKPWPNKGDRPTDGNPIRQKVEFKPE